MDIQKEIRQGFFLRENVYALVSLSYNLELQYCLMPDTSPVIVFQLEEMRLFQKWKKGIMDKGIV